MTDFQGTAGNDIISQAELKLTDWTNIYAGDGDDQISVGIALALGERGNDTITGYSVYSTATYWNSPSAIYVDLNRNIASDGFGTTDRLLNVHQVHGSAFADTFIGSETNDVFFTGRGNDFVDGGNGYDTVHFYFSPSTKFNISYDGLTNLFTISNTDPNDTNFGSKTIKNVERIQFQGPGSDFKSITSSALLPSAFTKQAGIAESFGDAGANPRWTVTDLNGDGFPDLALRFDPLSAFSTTATGASPIRFYLYENGSGFQLKPLQMSANLSPTLVAEIGSADFNKDGKGDIVIAASGQDPYENGKPVGPWLGELSYVLLSGKTSLFSNLSIPGIPKLFAHNLSVGDINGDGYPDAFIGSIWQSASSYFLLNETNGELSVDRSRLPQSVQNPTNDTFFVNGTLKYSQNIYTASLLADVNNDDSLDLILLPMGETKNGKVFLNDGHGYYSDTKSLDLPTGPFGPGFFWNAPNGDYSAKGTIYLGAIAMDANNDGFQDIISISTGDDRSDGNYKYYNGAALQILINNGGKSFTDETSTRTNFFHNPNLNYSHYPKIVSTDFNADGFKDIILYRQEGNQDGAAGTRILLNDGYGHFNEQHYPVGIDQGLIIAIDPTAGIYALVKTESGDIDPSTGQPSYLTQIDSLQFDWSAGRDFFTGSLFVRSMTSDIAGRWIHGNAEDNVITLNVGDEAAFGYEGNDIFYGGSGNDTINGGNGLDTAIFAGRRLDYSFSNTQVSDSIRERDGIDTIISVERIRFSDTTIGFDIDGNVGQAYRLYQAALDRTPDQRGLADWINYMDNGGKLNAMSQMFIDSHEFRAKYGALDNLGFVNQLYLNVLDRAGEAKGVSDWVGALNGGAWTRAEVLAGFSESAENQANVLGQIKNGIPYVEYWLS